MDSDTGRGGEPQDLLFYDGDCGLCHGLVRFAARRSGTCRFAPLGGATFRARVPEARRAGLPDAVVLLQGSRLLTRSDAVLGLLRSFGGGWARVAALGGWVPRRLRDWAYDRVARLRRLLFRRPRSACPLLPDGLRDRLDP